MVSLFRVYFKSQKDETSANIIHHKITYKTFYPPPTPLREWIFLYQRGLVLLSNIIFVPRVLSDFQSLTASSKFSNCIFSLFQSRKFLLTSNWNQVTSSSQPLSQGAGEVFMLTLSHQYFVLSSFLSSIHDDRCRCLSQNDHVGLGGKKMTFIWLNSGIWRIHCCKECANTWRDATATLRSIYNNFWFLCVCVPKSQRYD